MYTGFTHVANCHQCYQLPSSDLMIAIAITNWCDSVQAGERFVGLNFNFQQQFFVNVICIQVEGILQIAISSKISH